MSLCLQIDQGEFIQALKSLLSVSRHHNDGIEHKFEVLALPFLCGWLVDAFDSIAPFRSITESRLVKVESGTRAVCTA